MWLRPDWPRLFKTTAGLAGLPTYSPDYSLDWPVGNTGAAPSEKTAQKTASAVKRAEDAIKSTARETTCAVRRTEDAVREAARAITSTENAIEATTAAIARTQGVIQETQAEIVQQGQTLTSFTIVTTAFLPLGFCTSVFYLLSVICAFSDK